MCGGGGPDHVGGFFEEHAMMILVHCRAEGTSCQALRFPTRQPCPEFCPDLFYMWHIRSTAGGGLDQGGGFLEEHAMLKIRLFNVELRCFSGGRAGSDRQPPEREKIVFFESPDVYHRSPDSEPL